MEMNGLVSLQDIYLELANSGFPVKWVERGLLVEETPRIVRRLKTDGVSHSWTMYGVSYRELLHSGMYDYWGISLVLGGPPFWTTYDKDGAEKTSRILAIPILEYD